MNAAEVNLLWLYVRELWPTYPMPATDVEANLREQAWLDVLGDLDANLVRAAAAQLAADREFAPNPGQLRQAAVNLTAAEHPGDPDHPPPPPDVAVAWGEVIRAIARVGRYRVPEWSHPAISEAVASMGWTRLCDATEPGVALGQFRAIYAATSERVRRATSPILPVLAQRIAGTLNRIDDVPELGR